MADTVVLEKSTTQTLPGTAAAIRVVVADTDALCLLGVGTLLQSGDHYELVGTARSSDELERVADLSDPDVVLIDQRLFPGDLMAILDSLPLASADYRVIVTGCVSSGHMICDLFQAGVSGYLDKNDDLELYLLHAIDAVAGGRVYLSPTANSEYLCLMQSGEPVVAMDQEARAVLKLIAAGENPQTIAQQLGSSVRRVYWVQERLRRRFGAASNEAAMVQAMAEGYIIC